MNVQDLQKLGLTQSECRLYQAVLENGECTRAKVAKLTNISPSKVYDVANRLVQKGMIATVKKQGVTRFRAADPRRIADLLQKRREEIDTEQALLDKMLPDLMTKYTETIPAVDVEVYHGWEGLKTAVLILENSMGPGDISYVFGASIGKNPEQGDVFFRQHQRRIEERGYHVHIIFNEDMRKRKQRHEYYDDNPRHEIRYLHQETLTELYIYKEMVLILVLLSQPIGILLRSTEAVDAFTKFFKTMWKLAKE